VPVKLSCSDLEKMRYFDFEKGRAICISEILGSNENDSADEAMVQPLGNRITKIETEVNVESEIGNIKQKGNDPSVLRRPAVPVPGVRTTSTGGRDSGATSPSQQYPIYSLSEINCDRSADLEEFKIKILDIQQMCTSTQFNNCIHSEVVPFLLNAKEAMMYLTETDKLETHIDEEASILIHSRASNCLTEVLRFRGRIEQKLPLSLTDENHDVRWIMLSALKAFRRFCVEIESIWIEKSYDLRTCLPGQIQRRVDLALKSQASSGIMISAALERIQETDMIAQSTQVQVISQGEVIANSTERTSRTQEFLDNGQDVLKKMDGFWKQLF